MSKTGKIFLHNNLLLSFIIYYYYLFIITIIYYYYYYYYYLLGGSRFPEVYSCCYHLLLPLFLRISFPVICLLNLTHEGAMLCSDCPVLYHFTLSNPSPAI